MKKRKVLIKFWHGLGDATQFTVVLKHLRRYRPDWDVDLLAWRGKHSVGRGLCRYFWHEQEQNQCITMPGGGIERINYDDVYDLSWDENYCGYVDKPNSKITKCLDEVFHIKWDEDLCRYEVNVREETLALAKSYLEKIGCRRLQNGRYNAVVMHYQGNTSPEKKNASYEHASALCDFSIKSGFVPIILDWDDRSRSPDGSRLPDDKTIFCPRPAKGDIWGGFGSGDAEVIAALIEQSSAFVGIDSGPGKVASATSTPTFICWFGHHPIQFHDPAPNTKHLIPQHHLMIPPVVSNDRNVEVSPVARWFLDNYNYETYASSSDLVRVIIKNVAKAIGVKELSFELPRTTLHHGFHVPAMSQDQAYVIIKDVYKSDAYKIALRPKRGGIEYVVDVGANIGCFAKLWHERNQNAKIVCIEMHPKLIEPLAKNVKDFANIEHAACTYENGDLRMLDACGARGRSIGGSAVVSVDQANAVTDNQYDKYVLPVPKLTLEDVMAKYGMPHIDVLKLDCEGSEFSIIDNCDLSKVHVIFAESHDPNKWRNLLRTKLKGWVIAPISASPDGIFENWHCINPTFNGSSYA